MVLLTTYGLRLTAALAAEPSSEHLQQLARADLLLRKQDFSQAAEELGRAPKDRQEDPQFRRYAGQALAKLYGSERARRRPRKAALASARSRSQVAQKLRVTRRKHDADARSDRSFDNRGWQVNQIVESDVGAPGKLRAHFLMGVDGYRDGHNDLRYRALLADLYQGQSHWALGDSASDLSPYFLRGSRLRGMNLLFQTDHHQLQAVVGAYPVWLESRDEYVYPRTVWGIRDRIPLWEKRLKLGMGLIQTRDSEKIRTLDGANPQARVDPVISPRDNTVFSLEQEVQIIPQTWSLKAYQAYSVTDESLIEDRFGRNDKLKDSSFQMESAVSVPWARWQASLERTGPDFRLLTDLPQGSVNSPKDFRADVLRNTHFLDLAPVGPWDLDLEASWMRNNLDDDDTVARARQAWYTADLGVRVPRSWPKPRFRGALIHTVTVPGSTTRPSETRRYDLRGELSKTIGWVNLTGFGEYEVEHPLADRTSFDEEIRWAVGGRMGMPLWERLHVSPHYRYEFLDELFDETRARGTRQEAGISGSVRLWSTASLGLGYDFFHGRMPDPGGTGLLRTEGHSGTMNFSWPTTRHAWSRRRKLSFSPALTLHFSDFEGRIEQRPLVGSRLKMGYEVLDQWRVELGGEYRFDEDQHGDRLRTEESRVWLLWSSEWR